MNSVAEIRKAGRPANPDKHLLTAAWHELSGKKKFKKLIILCKKSIKNNLKSHKIKLLNIFWISIIIIILPIGIRIERKINMYDFNSEGYSYIEKVNILRKSWMKYRELKPHELHIAWMEFLKTYTYVQGGDPVMGQIDCLRACLMFLKSRGANIDVATIPVLIQKFQAMQLIEYTSSSKIKTGDIIIFKPVNGVWHIGLVQEKRDNFIKYMDFSPLGVGYPIVSIGDWKIQMVIEMSFPIWAGDILRQ